MIPLVGPANEPTARDRVGDAEAARMAGVRSQNGTRKNYREPEIS